MNHSIDDNGDRSEATPKQEVAQFFAPGDPKGQPRPRAFARKMGDKFVARVYDAGTAEGWKSCVALAARECLPRIPWWQPLRITLQFLMPRPRKHYRTGKRSTELRDDSPLWHAGKPDTDNLAKAVLDALGQVGMYKDDGQVVSLSITKRYASETGCRIKVEIFE